VSPRSEGHAWIAWRRLSRSRRAVFGLVILAVLALAGVFAEVVASPAPIFAAGPGGISLLPGVVHAADYASRGRAEIERRHRDDAAIWPWVRFGPNTPDDAGPNAPAGNGHPLGTDAEGRDLFARLVYGARTALGLSLFAVSLGMLLGTALGGLAGQARGFWDDRLVRLVETVDTFPTIIVVALVRAIERHPSALSLVLAVAFVRWAEVARLVRAEVVRATTEDYVVAARALGASPARVFARHILPNAMGPAVVSSVFGVASVVLLEAAISFLGMGAESSVASWGETLAEGARDPGRTRLLLLPGALLVATVGGTYLIAAALRDATDPRLRGK
jgi:peptide/nickel transport system permease protein